MKIKHRKSLKNKNWGINNGDTIIRFVRGKDKVRIYL